MSEPRCPYYGCLLPCGHSEIPLAEFTRQTVAALTEHLAVIEFVQVTRDDPGAERSGLVLWEDKVQ